MQWTGMGKITVAAAGTPNPLSPASIQVKVNSILVTFDSTDGSVIVFVKDAAGNVIAPVPTSQPLLLTSANGNQLDLRNFQIDSNTNGKGPYVAYGVE